MIYLLNSVANTIIVPVKFHKDLLQPWRIFSFSLLLLTFSIAAYFGAMFGRDVWSYLSLNREGAAKVLEWQIKEVGSRYSLEAKYEYNCQEKILKNNGKLPVPLFLNEEAAVAEMKSRAKESLSVYYDPSHPTRSSLDRAFPVNYGIRFIVSVLVLIYFFIFKKKLNSIFNQ